MRVSHKFSAYLFDSVSLNMPSQKECTLLTRVIFDFCQFARKTFKPTRFLGIDLIDFIHWCIKILFKRSKLFWKDLLGGNESLMEKVLNEQRGFWELHVRIAWGEPGSAVGEKGRPIFLFLFLFVVPRLLRTSSIESHLLTSSDVNDLSLIAI